MIAVCAIGRLCLGRLDGLVGRRSALGGLACAGPGASTAGRPAAGCYIGSRCSARHLRLRLRLGRINRRRRSAFHERSHGWPWAGRGCAMAWCCCLLSGVYGDDRGSVWRRTGVAIAAVVVSLRNRERGNVWTAIRKYRRRLMILFLFDGG